MSTNLTAVLQEILQNPTNLKGLRQLMTPDVTYVSLSFDKPELKKVMPWTGTHKGPQALADVFGAIQRFWKTLDFKVTDVIEQGSRVALFGSFTYKSNMTGKEVTSHIRPVAARFRGGKGRLHPVSRRQLWHCGFVQNRRRYTVPQRSLGRRD